MEKSLKIWDLFISVLDYIIFVSSNFYIHSKSLETYLKIDIFAITYSNIHNNAFFNDNFSDPISSVPNSLSNNKILNLKNYC